MLEVLQRVVQEVNAARDLDEVLAIIVRQIKQVMAVDVASVYLTDFEQNEHVLMTSDGLNPEAIRLNIRDFASLSITLALPAFLL